MLGALIILLPVQSLVQAMIVSQTINGLLLPVILVVMLVLINDQRLMGKHTNGRLFNWIAWVTVIILTVLALALLIATFFPGSFAPG